MKVCSRCKKEKQDNEFSTQRTKKSGYKLRLQSYCILCQSEYTKENREKINARHRERRKTTWYSKERIKAKEYRIKYREKYLWTSARDRCRKSKLEFSIKVEDIVIPEYCPLLGFPLTKGIMVRKDPNAPSLDRVDNSKGYIKGNVKVISYKANAMKNNASIESLKTFCKNLFEYLKTSEND
jgi:hypothetical protein